MEASWAHNPEVGRSKLPPANFFPRISEKNRNSYLTIQQERIRRNLHYIASEEPQYKVDTFHETLSPAGWRSGSVLGP